MTTQQPAAEAAQAVNEPGAARMVARVWTKKQTQKAIKFIRAQRLKVIKNSAGIYECFAFHMNHTEKGKQLIFSAMPGTSGYLVRHDVDLFLAAELAAVQS